MTTRSMARYVAARRGMTRPISYTLAMSSRARVACPLRRHDTRVWLPSCQRDIHLAPFVMPPLIFAGLFVALWCWKCTMLVLFQNTIIYNPFLPPNSRSLRIAEFARECGGLQWREERIRSLDGTGLGLAVVDVSSRPVDVPARPRVPVYILYFQGNASSLPPRLPDLSWILRRLRDADEPVDWTMVCLSYRGYWTSDDRPSERGINMDSEAALQWVHQLHRDRCREISPAPASKPIVLLWGQSIGCGFVTNLAANSKLDVEALVLETPFTCTRDMLRALYPQKWLPYQYLWPFLRSQLDSLGNMERIAQKPGGEPPGIYMVEGGKDELVPADHGIRLDQRCRDLGLRVQRQRVRSALHNEVMVRKDGKNAIARSLLAAVANARERYPRALEKEKSQGDDQSAGSGEIT